jgi:excinuclease UvrABC helicase subunit UvrB
VTWRRGESTLVGINLPEADLPEVSLVAILDAARGSCARRDR